MNPSTIGLHAGMVWNLLSDGHPWKYTEIKRQLKLKDRELNAALGWLAREGKLEFQSDTPESPETLIWLKEAVCPSNFFF
ncbi:MAG: winged helix-turn-helix domain-containing protein [Alistipes sp.]|nr:winged helix-turn-helix domain-containing protein [Alistipes sp.]